MALKPWRGSPALLIAAVAAPIAASPSRAAELCVSCAGPDTNYACVVDGVGGEGGADSFKLLCISELAKAGGHTSCAVARVSQPPCQGERRTLAAPAGLGTMPAANTAAPSGVPMPGPTGADNNAVYRGVSPADPANPTAPQQATGDAPTSPVPAPTGDGGSSALEKASSVIGDAAKASWRCVSSLFGDC